MLNDYHNFIENICEDALNKNDEFRKIQRQLAEAYKKNDIENYSELSIRLQIIVEKVCFETAIKELVHS